MLKKATQPVFVVNTPSIQCLITVDNKRRSVRIFVRTKPAKYKCTSANCTSSAAIRSIISFIHISLLY